MGGRGPHSVTLQSLLISGTTQASEYGVFFPNWLEAWDVTDLQNQSLDFQMSIGYSMGDITMIPFTLIYSQWI